MVKTGTFLKHTEIKKENSKQELRQGYKTSEPPVLVTYFLQRGFISLRFQTLLPTCHELGNKCPNVRVYKRYFSFKPTQVFHIPYVERDTQEHEFPDDAK